MTDGNERSETRSTARYDGLWAGVTGTWQSGRWRGLLPLPCWSEPVTWGSPTGTRMDFGGRNVHTLVFQTRQPARIDDYATTSGAAADVAYG
jgi:hypothetical protein